MFSLPISWPWSGALGRAFSLDSWLAHLRSWHHHEPSRSGDVHSYDLKYSADASSIPKLLTVDLPSPTVQWSFGYELQDLESDTGSESSCDECSRCQSPTVEHDYQSETTFDTSPDASFSATSTNAFGQARTLPVDALSSRQSLLAQYSEQELVLLEFLTHSSDFNGRDIDEVLHRYRPGFSKGCQCDPDDDEGNLCEVCQLTEAYLDYSFERYQGLDALSA